MAAEDWMLGCHGYYDSDDPQVWDYMDWGETLPLHVWIAQQEDKLARDIKIVENKLLRRLRRGTINHPVKGGNDNLRD